MAAFETYASRYRSVRMERRQGILQLTLHGDGASLVNEVLPAHRLLPRAWELAERLARHPMLQLKYTRRVLTDDLRRRLREHVGYSLALEAPADQERPERPREENR